MPHNDYKEPTLEERLADLESIVGDLAINTSRTAVVLALLAAHYGFSMNELDAEDKPGFGDN